VGIVGVDTRHPAARPPAASHSPVQSPTVVQDGLPWVVADLPGVPRGISGSPHAAGHGIVTEPVVSLAVPVDHGRDMESTRENWGKRDAEKSGQMKSSATDLATMLLNLRDGSQRRIARDGPAAVLGHEILELNGSEGKSRASWAQAEPGGKGKRGQAEMDWDMHLLVQPEARAALQDLDIAGLFARWVRRSSVVVLRLTDPG
jgi:hypothetical protein